MIPDQDVQHLAQRHQALEQAIQTELAHTYHDNVTVTRMKLEKLYLKEQMDRLRQTH